MTVQPARRDLRDFVVPPSILACAIALGVAAHVHLDVPAELAAALGMLLFSFGLVGHVILGRPKQRPGRVRRRRESHEKGAQAANDAVVRPVWTEAAAPAVADKGPPPPLPRTEAATESEAAGWDLRPGDPELTGAPAPVELTAEAAPADATASMAADDPVEQERVTAVLRRLATELRAAEPALETQVPLADSAAVAEPAAPAAPAEIKLGAEPSGIAADKPVTSLSDAVDALRTTMDAMRAVSAPRPEAPAAVDTPQVGSEAEIRLAAVAEALARERIEVFLEPIIGLADDSTHHFEVTVRLRGADNNVLDPGILATTARGAEIVPLLDAVRVRHAAGIAMKLERSGRRGSVFSDVAGPSLESRRFVEGVSERQAFGLADRIVLTFLQNEVRGLGPAQLAALAGLRDLGFRFALQGIADLDMDFETLHLNGFEFVKLDATVFLDGLPLLGGRVPSSDICRHFASLGMTVIVGRVDDEAMRARILGFGVLFGQGVLFGGPRPVRIANAPRPQDVAGAAA